MKKYYIQIILVILLVGLTLGDCLTTKMGLERGFNEAVNLSSKALESGTFYLFKALSLIPIIVALLVAPFTYKKWVVLIINIPSFIECLILASAVINNLYVMYSI